MAAITTNGVNQTDSYNKYFKIAAEKLDQHVIGRISAAAQIPFHTLGFMAQVLKVIARYPVCAFQDWYLSSRKEVDVIEDMANIEFTGTDDDEIKFPAEEGDDADFQKPKIKSSSTRSSGKNYMLPVEKDFIAAYIILKRIGRNFSDLFFGSRQTSTTFKEAVVNMVTVPLASTFLTPKEYLDYQEISIVAPLGVETEKTSVDEMIQILLPTEAIIQTVVLEIGPDKLEVLDTSAALLKELENAIQRYNKSSQSEADFNALRIVDKKLLNQLSRGEVVLPKLTLGKHEALKKYYREGLISYELHEFINREMEARLLETLLVP